MKRTHLKFGNWRESTLARIETVAQPVIGQWYLVPCYWRREARTPEWWPVIGPWHEDAEIGFQQHHYHFDLRFFTRSQLELKAMPLCRQLARVAINLDCPSEEFAAMPLEWRRRLMVREMPDFPAVVKGEPSRIAWLLEPKYKDAVMRCRICPHRGLPLTGLPERDGAVICPGHGLKWNTTTGALVPREMAKEANCV